MEQPRRQLHRAKEQSAMTRTLNPIRFGLNPRDIPFPELPAQVRAAEEAG